MARREYKAVAMPQLVTGPRRRGRGGAELVAETVGKVINAQAARGWVYAGSDSYRAMERPRWWSRPEEVIYTVLLFERPADERPAGDGYGRRAAAAPAAYDPESEPEAFDDEALAAELDAEAAPAGGRRGRLDDRAEPGFGDRAYGDRGRHRDDFDEAAFDDAPGGYDSPGFEERRYAGSEPSFPARAGGYDKEAYDADAFADGGYDDGDFEGRGYEGARRDDHRFGDSRRDPRDFDDDDDFGDDPRGAAQGSGFEEPRFDERRYEGRRFDDEGFEDEGFDERGFDDRGFDERDLDRGAFEGDEPAVEGRAAGRGAAGGRLRRDR